MNVTNRFNMHHAAVVLAMCVIPLTAHAGSPSSHQNVAKVQVDYTDLNLSTEAGKKALYYRISSASRAVCGDQNSLTGAGSLKQLMLNRQCYDTTMVKAYADIHPEIKRAGVANLTQ